MCSSVPAGGSRDYGYPIGERLAYRLYWGIIPVGNAWLSSDWEEEDGKVYIVLRAIVRTGPIVDRIYPVDDYVETVVDPSDFLPVQYTQRMNEGRDRRHGTTVFDHGRRRAHWSSPMNGSTGVIHIAEDSREVLSLFYEMRATGMEVGETVKRRAVVGSKLYEVETTALARDRVWVPGFGRVRCIKVEPKAKFGQIFLRRGRIQMWFSADERKVPVKMTGQIPLVSVKAILTGVSGPGDDRWVRER